MRYRVTGADRATGAEVIKIVEANDEAEAERACAPFLLVAEVRPEPDDLPAITEALAYASPAYAAEAPQPYADLLHWANRLRLLSLAVIATSLLIVLVIWTRATLRLAADWHIGWSDLLDALLETLPPLWGLGFALLLRVAAAVALAVRDIAIRVTQD